MPDVNTNTQTEIIDCRYVKPEAEVARAAARLWKRAAKENRASAILSSRQWRHTNRMYRAMRDESERLRALFFLLRRSARPMMQGAAISEEAWKALKEAADDA